MLTNLNTLGAPIWVIIAIIAIVVIADLFKALQNIWGVIAPKIFGIQTKVAEKKKREAEMEQRLKTLEKHDQTQYGKLEKIALTLDKLTETLAAMNAHSDEITVATMRSTLYRLHEDFTGKKYVTSEGLKTFTEIGRLYEAAGGDDVYHSKLYPEVMALPLKNEI